MDHGTVERDYGTPHALTEDERERIMGTAHVHVFTRAGDCDGRHEHEAIMTSDTARGYMSAYAAEDDQEFTDALLRMMIRLTASWQIPTYGNHEVTFSSREDDDGNLYVHAVWDTEEGFVSISFEGCMSDGCGRGHVSSRDLTAERAGY